MINKNIIALGFVSFFTDMASAMVTTILPIFIVYTLNEGVDKLGYVVAIATFVSYSFRILFGYLSDRLQIVKPFVVTGYIISAITKPMLAFASSWHQVAILRGAERVGKAIRSATKDSLISTYSQGSSGKSFGFHKMMDVAGEMSGALIAFLALYLFGKSADIFKDIFLWTLLPGILSIVIVIFFVQDTPYKAKKEYAKFDFDSNKKIIGVLILYFLFIFFLFNDSFFLVVAKDLGIDIAFIPLLMVLYNFVQTLLSYYFGVQIDKKHPSIILAISMLFAIASMFALYINQVILAFILLGVFTVASLNAIRAWISKDATNKGTIYGIFYGGVAIFSSLGATIIGNIWHHFGREDAIIYSIVGMSIVGCLYVTKWHKSI